MGQDFLMTYSLVRYQTIETKREADDQSCATVIWIIYRVGKLLQVFVFDHGMKGLGWGGFLGDAA